MYKINIWKIYKILNFNESLAGKVDSRLVSKYKKWLESEKPDYFEVIETLN
jgi:hypothetical protein